MRGIILMPFHALVFTAILALLCVGVIVSVTIPYMIYLWWAA